MQESMRRQHAAQLAVGAFSISMWPGTDQVTLHFRKGADEPIKDGAPSFATTPKLSGPDRAARFAAWLPRKTSPRWATPRSRLRPQGPRARARPRMPRRMRRCFPSQHSNTPSQHSVPLQHSIHSFCETVTPFANTPCARRQRQRSRNMSSSRTSTNSAASRSAQMAPQPPFSSRTSGWQPASCKFGVFHFATFVHCALILCCNTYPPPTQLCAI